MFQSTDSSNDEIYGFDGESYSNGKSRNKNKCCFVCVKSVENTLFLILIRIAWGSHANVFCTIFHNKFTQFIRIQF